MEYNHEEYFDIFFEVIKTLMCLDWSKFVVRRFWIQVAYGFYENQPIRCHKCSCGTRTVALPNIAREMGLSQPKIFEVHRDDKLHVYQ